MALTAKSISGLAGGSGLDAAATARPLSGARGVASAAQRAIEGSNFAGGIGVNDNAILHYDSEGSLDQDGRRKQQPQRPTPFLSRGAFGFQVENLADSGSGGGMTFLSDLMHGIATYENNIRLITGTTVSPPGSMLNQLL